MDMRTSSITLKITSIMALCTLLNACATYHTPTITDGPPDTQLDSSTIKNAQPKAEQKSRYGNPHSYVVNGKRYYVLPTAEGYKKRGIASWYGTKFHGQLTSTREAYNMYDMTAASPELPIPCYAKVTNLTNGRAIIVKINDRGPFAPNRIIDLSYAAATKLDITHHGTALVEVETIVPQGPSITNNAQYQATQPGKLYLQAGAFHSHSNAISYKHQLQAAIHEPIRVVTQRGPSNILYLVQIGPIDNANDSDKIKRQLTSAGYKNTIAIVS